MSKVKWVRLWDYIEQSDSKNSQSLYGIVSFPEEVDSFPKNVDFVRYRV